MFLIVKMGVGTSNAVKETLNRMAQQQLEMLKRIKELQKENSLLRQQVRELREKFQKSERTIDSLLRRLSRDEKKN